jgi:hypothetical protein
MNHIIEIIEVRSGVNLSGLDRSTPYRAKVLLDCGHTASIASGAAPAYCARSARDDALSWIGANVRCEHPSHREDAREASLFIAHLGETTALDRIRRATRIAAWRREQAAGEEAEERNFLLRLAYLAEEDAAYAV